MLTSSASMVASLRSGVDGFVVIPLGLTVDVDGELTAVRALDDEGLRVDVDADYGGVELIDVGAGG
jgi:hypothetical protein